MKKKENEFANTLDKLEVELQMRNQKKAIETRRSRKVEAIQEQKKEAREKFLEEEAVVAKSGEARDKMGLIISITVVALIIIVPFYRKDPVNFWFYAIVGICYFGFSKMKKNNK